MKDKILKTINAPWFPGILIILALIIFCLSVFLNKNQSHAYREEPTNALGTLTVKVEGLRNDKGNVIFCLYIAPPFTDQGNIAKAHVTDIVEGKAKAVFSNIPLRDYAVFVLHDENNNNYPDVDTKNNVLLEGLGFSNIKEPRQAIPEFDDAKFHLDQKTSEIQVSLFYY